MGDNLIVSCSYAENLQPRYTHFHMSYELIYIKEGTAKIIIDNKEYVAGDNTVVLINCFEQHSVEILSSTYKRYYITLSREKLDSMLTSVNFRLINMLRNRPTGFCHCLKAYGNMEDLFKNFIYEYENNDKAFSDEIVLSALVGVLAQVYRSNKENFTLSDANFKSAVYEIQNYIDQNFTSDIKILELSQMFYINKYYLSHIFKELTGYSPKQYLTLNRLTLGKSLLINTDLSVAEIAVKTGFADSNSFIRLFKKEIGVSPNKFRQ